MTCQAFFVAIPAETGACVDKKSIEKKAKKGILWKMHKKPVEPMYKTKNIHQRLSTIHKVIHMAKCGFSL
jgi:hypothetical protein